MREAVVAVLVPERTEDVVNELANVELNDGDFLPEGDHDGRPQLGIVNVKRIKVDVFNHLGDADNVTNDGLDTFTLTSQRNHLFTHHCVEVRHSLQRQQR